MTSQTTTGTLATLATTGGAGRAIVIGAGIGGLLAARALADHFPEVVVLDRDTLPDSPVHRRNVPHGQHVHGLLARGRAIVERLFPGIGAELVADGAMLLNSQRDVRWFQQGGYHADPKRGVTVLLQSRPLLEHHLRRRVAALPNVTILDGCQVTGLLASRDRALVTGVRAATVDDPTSEHELATALTVDASGRGSRLPAWLEGLGYEVPARAEAGVESRYATRRFRRAPGQGGARPVTVIVASPQLRRGGVMLAQEGDEWLVTLSSRNGIQPPTDLGGFIDWAKSLEAPDIYDVVRQAIPLDDGVIYRFPRSSRRQYERMDRVPAGVLPFGDAICAFNPVYAQGMSVAAIEAEALGRCLAAGTDGLWRRFLGGIAPAVEGCWAMAAAGDMRYADAPVELPRAAKLAGQYMARLLDAAQRDRVVAEAFQRVTNLVDPPQALRRPRIALRVACASRRRLAAPVARIETHEVSRQAA
jgi:2-polyprenyl-6-methoxyphenol hydroxylase-like FAD-dependent oxidoreductase